MNHTEIVNKLQELGLSEFLLVFKSDENKYSYIQSFQSDMYALVGVLEQYKLDLLNNKIADRREII